MEPYFSFACQRGEAASPRSPSQEDRRPDRKSTYPSYSFLPSKICVSSVPSSPEAIPIGANPSKISKSGSRDPNRVTAVQNQTTGAHMSRLSPVQLCVSLVDSLIDYRAARTLSTKHRSSSLGTENRDRWPPCGWQCGSIGDGEHHPLEASWDACSGRSPMVIRRS